VDGINVNGYAGVILQEEIQVEKLWKQIMKILQTNVNSQDAKVLY